MGDLTIFIHKEQQVSGGTQFMPGTSTGLDQKWSNLPIFPYTQTLTSVVGNSLPDAYTGLKKTTEATFKEKQKPQQY